MYEFKTLHLPFNSIRSGGVGAWLILHRPEWELAPLQVQVSTLFHMKCVPTNWATAAKLIQNNMTNITGLCKTYTANLSP